MDPNSNNQEDSETYSVQHLPNWQTDFIQNICCELQYAENPNRVDHTKDIVPWYIPFNYFKKPDPPKVNPFILNKVIYVLDPEVRSDEYFYDLLKLGLRIFLIQMKCASQYRCFLIIKMLKHAVCRYKLEIDPYIEISIGFEIIGRHCQVGRLRNDQPIHVQQSQRINITCDRRYSNNSTLANLFVNCQEQIINLNKYCRSTDYVIIEDGLFLKIVSYGQDFISCIAYTRDDNAFELKSGAEAYFPLILDKYPVAQELDDANFVKFLHGDFVITTNVDDIRYYGVLAALYSGLNIPIIAQCDYSRITQDAYKIAKYSFDGFMIGAEDKNYDIINASLLENKPIIVHINYFKMLREKTQNEQCISKIVNEIDCIIIDNVDDIKNILSIEAINISEYDRPSIMHCELNQHLRPGPFMLGTVAISSHILHANLIICTTHCGKTIKRLVKFRPNCIIFAVTTCLKTARRLMVYRGVLGLVWKHKGNRNKENEHILEFCLNYAKEHKYIKENQTVLYIYSDILTTFPNTFRIVTIEELYKSSYFHTTKWQ